MLCLMASPAYFFLLAFPIVQYVSHQRNLSETKKRHHANAVLSKHRTDKGAWQGLERVEMLFMQVLQ